MKILFASPDLRVKKVTLRRGVLPAVAAIALSLLTACSQKATDTAQEQSFLSACPGFEETGKAPLVYGAQCGTLSLAENPADANSRKIEVAVLRLPSISPVVKGDPLFLIQGGPGGSSIEMANFLHANFAEVRKNRDLIFVDQRGTGKSNALRCEAPNSDDNLLPEAEQLRENRMRLMRCAEQHKIEAAFYTTPFAVQDLDAVRQALGYKTINIWGGSYGTRVALEYARRYSHSTRAIILDGVAPVAIALPRFFARDTMAALKAVNDECAQQPDCFTIFGDIVEKAQRVAQRLAQAQAADETLVVTAPHPRHQQPETIHLTPNTFSQLIFMALYSRDLTVLLPRAISEAEQENYQLLAALAALSAEQSQQMNLAEAMHYSVVCNEDWHFNKALEAVTDDEFLGKHFMQEMATVCEFWPKASLPDDYWEPIVSDVPALLLSGAHDPVTPVAWAELVANSLPNAIKLRAAGGNHGVSSEGCIPQVIAQFVEQGNLQNTNTDCVAKIKPLPLVLGANQRKSSSAGSMLSAASSVSSADMISSSSSAGSLQP